MKRLINYLSLFGSLSTLFCCALPVLFVSVGMGAALASVGALFPQIYWLVERKDTLFLVTAVMLGASYWLMQGSRKLSCPEDAEQREVCEIAKPVGQRLFYVSVLVYIVGFVFSYVLPWLWVGNGN